MATNGGGKAKKPTDDGDLLAAMLHKTSLKDKRIRKQPERLTIAHTPKKAAATKKAAAPKSDASPKSDADRLLRIARFGMYDQDEEKAMASSAEAERIQIEKIHAIHKVLDAELTLLEKIRLQIQYRKDHFAKKNADAAAAGPSGAAAAAAAAGLAGMEMAMALVPRSGSVSSQDAAMKSRSGSRSSNSKGAQMAAPGDAMALPAPMAQDGGKKKRAAK